MTAEKAGIGPSPIGTVDDISAEVISGWAWDPQRPTESIVVDIFDGDDKVVSVRADQFRQDLREAGIGTGHHAFLLRNVRALFPLPQHRIAVRRASDGLELAGSPRLLAFGDAGKKVPAKPALVILGMHRSGTSALAAAFGAVGWRLPLDVMPALPGNPEGFNESIAVANLNESILHEAGSAWNSTSPVGVGGSAGVPWELLDIRLDEARAALRTAFGGADAICLKCPRSLLVASLWHTALRLEGYAPRYVLSLRHPLEVADSLTARDGLARPQGLRLWMRYALALAELPPGAVVESVIGYQDLVSDPAACVGIAYDRGVVGRRSELLRAAVNSSLRHHRHPGVKALPEPVRSLYEMLRSQPLGTSEDRARSFAGLLARFKAAELATSLRQLPGELPDARLEDIGEGAFQAFIREFEIIDHAP